MFRLHLAKDDSSFRSDFQKRIEENFIIFRKLYFFVIMRKHFLKTAMMILVVLAMVGLGMSLTACDDDISVNSPVSYGFAKIQYHYQHDALLEEYWQESYTIQSGQTHQVTTFYTPPMRSGYIFAGWTLETGGAGEVLTTPFSITGAGGGGNIYKLYAKWEPDVSSLTSTNFLHFFDVTTAVTTSVPYTGARTFRARAEVSLKDGINLPSND
ncbi:MAG: hypothetical protein FWG51_05290, partial [Firmicutes bacterium]|nr:hypothetical protein [Bacillota bacterium]